MRLGEGLLRAATRPHTAVVSAAPLGWVAAWRLTSDGTPVPEGMVVMIKVGAPGTAHLYHGGKPLGLHRLSLSLCWWEP